MAKLCQPTVEWKITIECISRSYRTVPNEDMILCHTDTHTHIYIHTPVTTE